MLGFEQLGTPSAKLSSGHGRLPHLSIPNNNHLGRTKERNSGTEKAKVHMQPAFSVMSTSCSSMAEGRKVLLSFWQVSLNWERAWHLWYIRSFYRAYLSHEERAPNQQHVVTLSFCLDSFLLSYNNHSHRSETEKSLLSNTKSQRDLLQGCLSMLTRDCLEPLSCDSAKRLSTLKCCRINTVCPACLPGYHRLLDWSGWLTLLASMQNAAESEILAW